jgi:hypothetical protein
MNPESARLLTLAGEYRTQSRIAKANASLRRIGASRSIPYSPEPARTGHRFGLQATPHVNICWRENEPTNQVASLDEFRHTPRPYLHMEGDWSMWKDW